MKKLLILFGTVAAVVILGYFTYKEGALAVNKGDSSTKIFVVEQGESLDSIINNLSKENLIRNRVVFYLIVKQKGIERKIQAGDFRLSPSMNAFQIAKELTHGTLDVWVTIPEGLRKEEIAEIISTKLQVPESEFNALATEGHLFPDTYLIPKNPTAEQVIKILTTTFDQKITSNLTDKFHTKGLTTQQAIILASLVERESRPADRQEIANIIYKRYKNNWMLQVDATIQYALGYQPGKKTWWSVITRDDYKNVDSPYNTYLNTGLPPGPICNPGISSIEAVANANPNTKNWYYFHDKNGKAYFAVDIEEHENNTNK